MIKNKPVSTRSHIDLAALFTPKGTTQLCAELHSLRDYVRWLTSLFEQLRLTDRIYFGHGTSTAWDEAVALVLSTLCLPWDVADNDPHILNAHLTDSEKRLLLDNTKMRTVDRQPLPYIVGEAWLSGLAFIVDSNVLIPRSPMAELIEDRLHPWWPQDESVKKALDLCTGSGSLAVCMAMAFPEAAIDAVDLSPEALAIAQLNVQRHGLEDHVRLHESDLFDALLTEELTEAGSQQKYDIIISNPPYVGADEMKILPEEYRKEPTMALHAEENGLQIVSRILTQAKPLLSPKGLLIVEVGNTQAVVEQAFPELPFQWLEFAKGGFGVFLLPAEALPCDSSI